MAAHNGPASWYRLTRRGCVTTGPGVWGGRTPGRGWPRTASGGCVLGFPTLGPLSRGRVLPKSPRPSKSTFARAESLHRDRRKEVGVEVVVDSDLGTLRAAFHDHLRRVQEACRKNKVRPTAEQAGVE